MSFFMIALFMVQCASICTTDSWFSHHIALLSHEEQTLLLATLDAAIKRCNALITMQEMALTLAEQVQQEINMITETRLQPRKCLEYQIAEHDIFQKWFAHKQEYINVCLTYDSCVTLLDSNTRVLDAFNYVRHEARAAVLKATARESYRIKEYAATLNEYGQKALTSISFLQALFAKRSFVEDIAQWFASLLIMPFKQCNDQLAMLHEQSWQLVNKQQAFGNFVWRIIEEARLKIYQHYYYALALQLNKTRVMHEI